MSITVNKTQIFNFGGISPMCSMGSFMPVSIFGRGFCCSPFGMFPPMMCCFNPWAPLAAGLGFCLGSRIGLKGIGNAAKAVGKGVASAAKWVWNGVTSIFKKKHKAEDVQKVKEAEKDKSAQKS